MKLKSKAAVLRRGLLPIFRLARTRICHPCIDPLEDRRLLSVSLISENAAATGSGNNASGAADNIGGIPPVMSADGRFIAFVSEASDLTSGDANSAADVFERDDAQTGQTTLVSTATGGGSERRASGVFVDRGNRGISPDGRFVIFTSAASNLVPNDHNSMPDVFVRDTVNGTTTLVSSNAAGTDSGTGGSGAQAGSSDGVMSSDGRYVAFVSTAADLTAGPTDTDGGKPDVFLRDLQTNTTTQLSLPTGGGTATGDVGSPSISSDGRYVAFTTSDPILAGTASGGFQQVYVYDRQASASTLASPNASGTGASGSDAMVATISADGRSVAFLSDANDLVSGFVDTNGDGHGLDVFVRRLDANQTVLASPAAGSTTTAALGSNGAPVLSADGQYVAYDSQSTDLVTGLTDTNGGSDVFVRDVVGGTTRCASVTPAGSATGNANSGFISAGIDAPPAFSANGRYVAFASLASDLTAGKTAPAEDAYVRDLQTGTTTWLSTNSTNTGVGNVDSAAISSDGTQAAFVSDQGDLVTGDTNNASDVFEAAVPINNSGGGGGGSGAAGDLSVALASSLPPSAISGGRVKIPPVVTVTNTAQTAANGTVSIALFLSTDAAVDVNDVSLLTIAKKVKLKAGASKAFKIKVRKLPLAADGTYRLLAEVLPTGNTTADPNTANNIAASDGTIVVAAPFVNLSGTFAAVPASQVRSKATVATLTVSNAGNSAVNSPITIALAAAPAGVAAGTADVAIQPVSVRLRLKAGASKTLRLKYALPATFAAGDYNLVATLDSGNAVSESDETDNVVVSGSTFNVAP